MAKKNNKKGYLRLPKQVLNWSSVPKETIKILLQFDVTLYANGSKRFGIVGYPAKKNGKKWAFGLKILLSDKAGYKYVKLPLPITLSNLELSCDDVKVKIKPDNKSKLLFTPKLYTDNPHASYDVTLGGAKSGSSARVSANPCPQARPADE